MVIAIWIFPNDDPLIRVDSRPATLEHRSCQVWHCIEKEGTMMVVFPSHSERRVPKALVC